MRVLLGIVLVGIVWTQSSAGVLRGAWLIQADRAARAGDYARALRYYRKLGHADDRVRYNEGVLLYRMGRYAEALALFRTIRDPALEGRSLYNAGNCYMRLGRWSRALRFYEAAAKFLPGDPDPAANARIVRKALARRSLERALRELKRKNEQKVCKLERVDLGIRRGAFEGKSLGGDFPTDDRLEEARFGATLIQRDNVLEGTGRVDRARERQILESEENRTLVEGEVQTDSIRLRRIERRLRSRPLRTLLIPIEEER